MKTTLPGIFEKAFPGLFDSENNHGKAKHTGLSDDFFFQLAQNTRDIIFHAQLIPEFKFDYVSPSCYTLTGYTPEEFYADHQLMNKITHPDIALRDLHPVVQGRARHRAAPRTTGASSATGVSTPVRPT